MAARFRDINPDIQLHVINDFIKDDRMIDILEMAKYDYVVDAIDTLAPKIFLIYHSLQKGYRVVSSMGAGGKPIFRNRIIVIWLACCEKGYISWASTKG